MATVLSEIQKSRYARHLSLPEIDTAGQLRLLNSKALVVGAGGLGAPVAMYLAAAGVGTIGIVEFDVVDHSNLQRQILYATQDVGQSKLDTAEKKLRALNPDVTINKYDTRIDSSNAMEILAPYDVVINGTDNFPTRYLINDACVFKKVNVDGSIFRFEGLNTVFAPHLKLWNGLPMQTGCYRCQYPEPPPPGMVPSCAEGGVMGAMCGIVGSIQANEAIKVLARIGTPLFGRLQVLNALDMHIRTLKLRRDKNCPVCGDHPSVTQLIDYHQFCGMPSATAAKPILTEKGLQLNFNPQWEIHPTQVKVMLDRKEDFLLLDVRRPNEWNTCRIEGALLIPLQDLDVRAGELAAHKNRRIVTVCHHGVRSLNAAAMLRKLGHEQTLSMAGGMDAYSVVVDPSIVRY